MFLVNSLVSFPNKCIVCFYIDWHGFEEKVHLFRVKNKCCLIDYWKHFVQRSAKIARVPRKFGKLL